MNVQARLSEDYRARRGRMVDRDLAARGVTDRRVLDAMRTVPREWFLPQELADFAYQDSPLPIGQGQTISQPFIVAIMAAAAELTSDSRVLEIGTGSGYGAAVLSQIAAQVWTVERHEPLALAAERRLRDGGYANVVVVPGDGTLGLAELADFDAIVVTAGAPFVPEALLQQLADGGRLVIPVGPERWGQELLRIRRQGNEYFEENLAQVRFVPLIGEHGWALAPR